MSARRKPISGQTKHRSVAEKEVRQQAEASIVTSTDDIMTPPDWLNSDEAKEEWARVVPQLLKINIAGNLDLQALAGYCNAFANYRKAIAELATQSLVTVKEDEETGFVFTKENPLNAICIKWGTEMRKFADICGITMNSRLKAGQAKVDAEKQTIEDEFGDI